MASYYGVLFEEFWTGRTGREIRKCGGAHAQLLAAYLISNRHANMLGLYHLPLEDVCHETGLKRAAVRTALAAIERAGFARYDAGSEYVWVLTMFRFRLGLKPGQALPARDKRALGANRLFHRLDPNPFKAEFFAQTQPLLHLTAELSPIEAPSDGPHEGHTSPFEGASEHLEGPPEDLTSQSTEYRDQRSGTQSTDTHTDRAGAREVLGPRLIGNEHRAHASCGRVCVPAFLHRQLKDALGGDEQSADTKLRAWYLETERALPEDAIVPSDAAKFWRPRFDATFVTLAPVAVAKPVPVNRTGPAPAGKYDAITQGLPS